MVEASPDVLLVWRQLWFLSDQCAVDVADVVPPFPHQVASLLHKDVRACALPLGVIVREDLADVWQR